MATDAKIGLLVPGGFGGTPPSMAEFNGFFRRADELGYDSLWVIDRLFHNINIIDPMTLMACAAAVTDRIRLGTSVLLFVMRNPALVAKGISEALITTAGGLVVAVPTLIAYNYFTSQVGKFVLEMETAANVLLETYSEMEDDGPAQG